LEIPRNERDTVAADTPARRATSRMLTLADCGVDTFTAPPFRDRVSGSPGGTIPSAETSFMRGTL
jgi:hypothetical protein